MKTAFLARFQPMHLMHERLVKELNPEVILVGSSNKFRQKRNPFTYPERLEMIRKVFPEHKIIALPDLDNNVDWIKTVEEYRIISNNKKTTDLLPKNKLIIPKRESHISSTIIRNKILNDEDVKIYLSSEIFEYLIEIDGFEIIKEVD